MHSFYISIKPSPELQKPHSWGWKPYSSKKGVVRTVFRKLLQLDPQLLVVYYELGSTDISLRASYLYRINVELAILCYNFRKLLVLLCRPVLMSIFMIMSVLLRLRAWFIFKVYLYSYTNEVIIKMAKKLWTYGLQSIP